MNWLSRFDVSAATVYEKKIVDSYSWHRKIWECFPDGADAKRDFLTRIDELDGALRVWLLSKRQPVCPSWCPQDRFTAKEIAPSFLSYKKYHFDLRANPTKRLAAKEEGQKLGKRVPLIKQDDLFIWLRRKGETGGFRIAEDLPLEIGPMVQRHFRKGKHRGYHGGVQFRGTLEVVDQQQFKETYQRGIGGAKGFGFGLLLLAPIKF